MRVFKSIIWIGLSVLLTNLAMSSDFAKEKRWADQVVNYIIDGEVEWLNIDGHKILTIYTEATTERAKGSAIIVHGSGVHPNWQDVIYPLRTELPEQGWNTLSIQMPVLSGDAKYSDYADLFDEIAPRIDMAIKSLKQKGENNIVLISHSLGSTMSAYYLSVHRKSGIKKFIAIGIPGAAKDKRMNNLQSLEKIKIPVLDLYGSEDLESVLASAQSRSSAAGSNKLYSQQVVKGANHFFVDKNTELVQSVLVWLK